MAWRRSVRPFLIVIAIAFFGPQVGFADGTTPKPSYQTFVDWQHNKITIDATVDVSSLGAMLPDARSKAQELIRKDRATMIDRALFGIQADSFHTVGDLAASSPQVLTALQGLIGAPDEQYAKMSSDLTGVTVRYQVPIFPNLGQIFVNQVRPNPPSQLLSYVPTTVFSGIVIYAKGKLPIHGETREGSLVPSLFPRIWDQNMDLLASANTIDPEVLK
ncbi:MAG TPA: hypothetical protein VMW69_13550, partial [Spirochaetia bacterium]|nr:hypothetical protein [Spirochaetia bacterium]